MPDHLHLLVEGTRAKADLRSFVSSFKQGSGYLYRQRTRERLWQSGYYDRVLRGDEGTERVASYVLMNPVRAGLVRHPAEYAWVGSDRFRLVDLFDTQG